jgi:hypothetical protein
MHRLHREEREGVALAYVSGLDAQPMLREGRDTKARQPKARKEQDAIPVLFLKHSDITLRTYVIIQIKHLKHAFETLAKTHQNHSKTYATSG